MSLRGIGREIAGWSVKDWVIVLEALFYLVAARLAVWFVPFRRLASGLGQDMAESPDEIGEAQRLQAEKIGWAVHGLAQYLPTVKQCLVQATAATWMLKRRQIPSTLYFGVAREDAGNLEAHAWVRSGERVLTGARGHEKYRVVATFAETFPDMNRTLPR